MRAEFGLFADLEAGVDRQPLSVDRKVHARLGICQRRGIKDPALVVHYIEVGTGVAKVEAIVGDRAGSSDCVVALTIDPHLEHGVLKLQGCWVYIYKGRDSGATKDLDALSLEEVRESSCLRGRVNTSLRNVGVQD